MKKIIFFLISSFLLGMNASAKIWRVNNTGVPADFTTAQAAHDGAAAGDTLHFEASGASYGAISITKKLIIIGNGFLLGTLAANANPDLQANPASSGIGALEIKFGGDGTVVEGMTVTGLITCIGGVSNVSIRRNRVAAIQLGLCNNIQIVQNYMDVGGPFANIGSDGNPSTNLQINNNVFANGVGFGVEDNGDFMNNIYSAFAGGTLTLNNFRVWNNISIQGAAALNSCDSRSNIGNSTQFGTANGNQQNVTMTTVFEDLGNASPSFSEDSRWQLKAGSTAIGAAWNGVTTGGDCGIFGTSATGSPYILSGIPNVPSIYKLAAPAVVTGSTINITISTKTNN